MVDSPSTRCSPDARRPKGRALAWRRTARALERSLRAWGDRRLARAAGPRDFAAGDLADARVGRGHVSPLLGRADFFEPSRLLRSAQRPALPPGVRGASVIAGGEAGRRQYGHVAPLAAVEAVSTRRRDSISWRTKERLRFDGALPARPSVQNSRAPKRNSLWRRPNMRKAQRLRGLSITGAHGPAGHDRSVATARRSSARRCLAPPTYGGAQAHMRAGCGRTACPSASNVRSLCLLRPAPEDLLARDRQLLVDDAEGDDAFFFQRSASGRVASVIRAVFLCGRSLGRAVCGSCAVWPRAERLSGCALSELSTRNPRRRRRF
jgi:hypothetical protein